MKFTPLDGKLRLEAENDLEAAWLTTVKHRSVKPAAKGFVLNAYKAWAAAHRDCDPRKIVASTENRQVAHERRQAAEMAARLDRGETVAAACRLWQETYRTSPRFEVFYEEDGRVRVDMTDDEFAVGHVVTGYGPNKAMAKADAAEEFLRGH